MNLLKTIFVIFVSVTVSHWSLDAVAAEGGATGLGINAQRTVRTDAAGWTVVTPSKDSRIIYVSSSEGRDIAGKIYKASEINDLEHPGKVRAYKSLKLALSKMRHGYPDILLLKRGDEWTVVESIYLKGGRSATEKLVVMSYGESKTRPLLKSDETLFRIWGKSSHVAILGLSLYAHRRDPNSDEFAGWDELPRPVGIQIYGGGGLMKSYLIENNKVNFFNSGISITGEARYEDVVVRRNVITNSYTVKGHSQGFYATTANVLLEENVFDHNGWFKQKQEGLGDKVEGQATMFNHNTYFSNMENTVFRNNLFLRASSALNKWSSNPSGSSDSIMSRNLRLENNFYYGGEIGIGIGGNTDFNTGPRWENVQVVDNVLLGIGKDQPTGRRLGWYIGISDWNGGLICGNYLLHNQNPKVNNLLGINVVGHTSNLTIANNTITGLLLSHSNVAAISINDEPKENIQIIGNRIQLSDSKMAILNTGNAFHGQVADNQYYTDAAADQWFRVNGKSIDFGRWIKLVNDARSKVHRVSFVEREADLETYLKSVGIASLSEFFEVVANQSRSSWDRRLTAARINDFFRSSYGNLRCTM